MNSIVKEFIFLFFYLFLTGTAFFIVMIFVIALIGYYLHGILLFSWGDVQDSCFYGLLVSIGGTAMSVLYKINGWENER